MLALTLHRPWDQAITRLSKAIENRTWKPPQSAMDHVIAIHAGLKWDEDGAEFIAMLEGPQWEFFDADSPTGIVGVARIVGWFNTITDERKAAWNREHMVKEHRWSPWRSGPYCWVLADRRPLPMPVPCKGAQGLWTVPTDVERAVRGQL